MKRLMLTIALVLGFGAVAACNTVEGAGKDLKSAGDAIQKTAN